MQSKASDLELLRQLVRATLENVAPDEIPLVADFDGTTQTPSHKGSLGFGLEAMVGLLLPILWKFFEALISEFGKETAKESMRALILKLKLWLAGGAKRAPKDLQDELTLQLRSLGVPEDRLAPAVAAILLSLERNRGSLIPNP